MCQHFDPQVIGQCREDEAEEVLEKDRVNYCEWFSPSTNAFDGVGDQSTARAQRELSALFGDEDDATDGGDDSATAAEDLFR